MATGVENSGELLMIHAQNAYEPDVQAEWKIGHRKLAAFFAAILIMTVVMWVFLETPGHETLVDALDVALARFSR